jgi:phosphoribosylformylglycinamidine synthase
LKGLDKGLAVTTDCNSIYCYLNPYRGAQIAVAEAARNLICSGAEPAAVTDCLNFGNPTKPDRFWQFKKCVEGIVSACQFFNLPVVSGNVSFYNESQKGAIFPTPTIGMIGIVDNLEKICKQYFSKENEIIILLGLSKEELGGSQYLKEIYKIIKGDAPDLDFYLEEAVQKTALEAIGKRLISSAHDCSEGGLAVALAECCISNKDNMIGAVVDNLNFDIRSDALFFGESQSRIIISCKSDSVVKLKKIAQKYKAPFRIIGKTQDDKLIISDNKRKTINLALKDLSKQWRSLEKQISL